MPGTTPINGITFPYDRTDAPLGGYAMERLARDIDSRIVARFANTAERDQKIPQPIEGMVCHVAAQTNPVNLPPRLLVFNRGKWRLVGPSPLPSLTNRDWVLAPDQVLTSGFQGYFDITSIDVSDPGFPYKLQVLVAAVIGADLQVGNGRFDLSVKVNNDFFDALTLTPDQPSYQRLLTGVSDVEYTGATTVQVQAFRPAGTANGIVRGGNRILSVYRHAA